MVNVINNVKSVGSVIARSAATMLADKVQFVRNIDKEPADTFDFVNGYNVGDTVTINKPARFTTSTNADVTSAMQDVVEEKATLTLDTRLVVPVNLTSAEIQNELRLKAWTKRILDPAMSAMAQSVENTFLQKAINNTYNLVGTPGSTVFDTDQILQSREILKRSLVPDNGKLKVLLNSRAMRSAVNSRKGLFQQSDKIGEQYEEGVMGRADGFDFLENNLVPTHTRGTATGSLTVTTTSTEADSTIALTGTGAQTLKAGDVFTIASVNSVHPITKVSTGILQQFVVLANNTASSGSYTAVSISPSVYAASNGLQNIDALPQSSAVVTLVDTASTSNFQNLAFHKSAYRFVSVPLMRPDGAHMVGQETVDGMTIRIWMDANILTDKMIMRIDFLGGMLAVRPEWGCRITS